MMSLRYIHTTIPNTKNGITGVLDVFMGILNAIGVIGGVSPTNQSHRLLRERVFALYSLCRPSSGISNNVGQSQRLSKMDTANCLSENVTPIIASYVFMSTIKPINKTGSKLVNYAERNQT